MNETTIETLKRGAQDFYERADYAEWQEPMRELSQGFAEGLRFAARLMEREARKMATEQAQTG